MADDAGAGYGRSLGGISAWLMQFASVSGLETKRPSETVFRFQTASQASYPVYGLIVVAGQ